MNHKKNYFSLKQHQLRRVQMQDLVSDLKKAERIDLGLRLLSCKDSVFVRRREKLLANKQYKGLSRQQLGYICGCTDQAILVIEQRALAKIRMAIKQRGLVEEFRAFLQTNRDLCDRAIAQPRHSETEN
jgi:DNA-directed RNA polymerase sigma subunit (sigma70/sigma32)